MRLRRHPAGPDLGAWFDGEHVDSEVGGHVARCSRCRRSVSEMARVRAWIRAQPFFAGGGEEALTDARLRRWRPRAVAVSLVVVLALLVFNAPRLRGPERPSRPDGPGGPLLNTGAEGEARFPALSEPQRAEDAPASRPVPTSRPAPQPLRLGLVVPTHGTAAAEGIEVVSAVRQRVDSANSAGGVGGLPVELVVVAAEDQAAVASLPKRASVLVGGFGAKPPSGILSLLPADPSVDGPTVVPAEASPEVAGQLLGEQLRARGMSGHVGVVVGGGPERALAAGLASKVPTATLAAGPDGSCNSEVAALREDGAVALAVAGPPDLATSCLRAAARSLWAPPLGTIVSPSAAYGGLDGVLEARGTRTVLGLPWPTSEGAGPARFRSAAWTRSYRAMISFAAAELAMEVARRKGAVSMATVAAGRWGSDLVALDGDTVRSTPVALTADGWTPSAEVGASLLPPLLPVPVPGLMP